MVFNGPPAEGQVHVCGIVFERVEQRPAVDAESDRDGVELRRERICDGIQGWRTIPTALQPDAERRKYTWTGWAQPG